jgi:hypothetical protein
MMIYEHKLSFKNLGRTSKFDPRVFLGNCSVHCSFSKLSASASKCGFMGLPAALWDFLVAANPWNPTVWDIKQKKCVAKPKS